jgi:hypothetical protein
MPYKDADTARQYRRDYKRALRIEFANLRKMLPLHVRLGIETHVHRQAVLSDPRIKQWDAEARVYSFNHLYRESITLAGAGA